MPCRNVRLFPVIRLLLLWMASLYPMNEVEAADRTRLLVSAASSLTDAFEAIGGEFEQEHPGIDLIFNFSGSGVLRVQIERGAPVDVFASAGWFPMQSLIEKDRVRSDRVSIFANNRLVLVCRDDKDVASLGALLSTETSRVALGNPATVPAGVYARRALESLGFVEEFGPRLIPAENVRQVLRYVETGSVSAGLVYATDARRSTGTHVVEVFSTDLTGAIEYPVGVLDGSPRPREAALFVEYLFGASGRRILSEEGFLPGDARPRKP